MDNQLALWSPGINRPVVFMGNNTLDKELPRRASSWASISVTPKPSSRPAIVEPSSVMRDRLWTSPKRSTISYHKVTKSGLGNLTRWESEDRASEGGEEQSAKVETHLYGMTGVELYDSKVRDWRRMLFTKRATDWQASCRSERRCEWAAILIVC